MAPTAKLISDGFWDFSKRMPVNKSNRTTMRPLGIYFIGIYIYIGCDSFPDDFGQFPQFFLNANGHTDPRTYRHTDGRTDRPSYRDAKAHLKSERKN